MCIQLCLTLCDPMHCSVPDFSVHEILQTGILEWVANVLQGNFLAQGLNLCLLHLLHWQVRFFTNGATWEANLPHRTSYISKVSLSNGGTQFIQVSQQT